MGTELSGAIDGCDCDACELKRSQAEIERLQLENYKLKDEYRHLQAELADTSDTLQLHQISGDYEARRLLYNLETEIREQRVEIERLRCNNEFD